VVGVTLILHGTPQKIVQRGQIAVAWRPVDIAVSADYAIFERTAQKIDCDVGCVARSAVLLEPYVVYVFLFHSGKERMKKIPTFRDSGHH